MVTSLAPVSAADELALRASGEPEVDKPALDSSEELHLVLQKADLILDRLGAAGLTHDVRTALSCLNDELAGLRESGLPTSTWPGWARSADLVSVLDATPLSLPNELQPRALPEGSGYAGRGGASPISLRSTHPKDPAPVFDDVTPYGAHVSVAPPPGQVFADLLLLGATACQVPVALLSVPRPDGTWSTLWHGTNINDNHDNDQLLEMLASANGPIEFADLSTNMPRSSLVLTAPSMRWSYGLPLRDKSGGLVGVTAILDGLPRQANNRDRRVMMSLARRLMAELIELRGPVIASGLPLERGPAPHSIFEDAVHHSGQANSALSQKLGGTDHGPLRSTDVAEIFNVTPRTVINWATTGKMVSHRTLGGHLRFLRGDVLDAFSLMTRPPAGQTDTTHTDD